MFKLKSINIVINIILLNISFNQIYSCAQIEKFTANKYLESFIAPLVLQKIILEYLHKWDLKEIPIVDSLIKSINFSPDKAYFAISYRDNSDVLNSTFKSKLWKLIDSTDLFKELNQKHKEIEGSVFAFSPDSKYLTIFDKSIITAIELQNNKTHSSLKLNLDDYCYNAADICLFIYSNNGDYLIIATTFGSIAILKVADFKQIAYQKISDSSIDSAAISKDNKIIVTGTTNIWSTSLRDITLWDISLKNLATLSTNGREVASLLFSKNDQYLISLTTHWRDDSTGNYPEIKIWDLNNLKNIRCIASYDLAKFENQDTRFTNMSYSPDFKKLIISYNTADLKIWNSQNLRNISCSNFLESYEDKKYCQNREDRDYGSYGSALMPNNHTIIFGGIEGKINIWTNYALLLGFTGSSEFISENKIRECASCYKREIEKVKLQRCGACRSVLYCNRDCQNKDWDYHKQFCNKS